MRDDDWKRRGACWDTNSILFIPETRGHEFAYGLKIDYSAGRVYCDRCPVTEECLKYALATGEKLGLWGGKTPGQRQNIRQKVTSM